MEFTSEFYLGNRLNLLQHVQGGLVVLAANGVLQRSADTTYPFRQDSNFWYLTGISEPDYIVVCSESETFLIQPQRAEHRDLWDGAVDLAALRAISGITDILDNVAGWNKLDRLIKKHKKVRTITPVEPYYPSFGFYANPSRGVLLDMLKKHRQVELTDIRNQLARQRQIKKPVEINALQQAIDITTKTLTDIKSGISAYQTEYELVADVTAGFLRRGAMGHAYQPIVASEGNAATIHYMQCNDVIKENGLLLFDVGAEVHNYSADISRTYAYKNPTLRQKAVYSAVQRVQKAAFELIKPGVDMRKYEAKVDEIMALELKKLKLIDDVKDKKKLKKYYPHLTSHFLGLDTHDAADYALPLAPGMVLTVEPGIYIPEEQIGIRIEDDVLVTENGIEILSKHLPTTL